MIKGISAACRENGCALLGGETAEMPGFYQPGEYDLAGFVVGLVERDRAIDGGRIAVGDVLLALPSSGLHTNGYSLVRRVFGLIDASGDEIRRKLGTRYPELGRTLGEELMEPHRSYLPALRPYLGQVKGLAHITGGGLLENVPRVLPAAVAARFDSDTWTRPPIFDLIQRLGGIAEVEMERTFNLGLGMVVVVSPEDADSLQRAMPGCLRVGEIVPREGPAVVVR